tara:strand:- start:18 stop:677 length:660 start_codon:yes stop_codon:yes gene_type:complete
MVNKIIGFDMDGVLIDSLPLMELAWNHCSNILKFNVDFMKYKLHIGKPFGEIINTLDLNEYLPDIKFIYDDFCIKNYNLISPYEGIIDLLDFIDEINNCYVAIITSKTKFRAQYIASKLNLKNNILISPEDVPRGKPYADPLLKVNKFFDIRPNKNSSLYIGDMLNDYKASNSANWFFVLADWGYGNISDNKNLSQESEYVRVKTINELKTFLIEWLEK